MIDPACLPTWESVSAKTGLKPLHHNRGKCPFCGSSTGFSVHDEKGFHCFACGAHGDKISFIQQFHKCDFKDALRFFGLEPGKPPAPDPTIERRKKMREALRQWAKMEARKLRNEFYAKEMVFTRALARLRNNQDDPQAWDWLAWAFTGHAALENKLDMLAGTESQQIEVYKMRSEA
jgi:DNA primase